MFRDIFHRLLNPHCEHCIIIREQEFALAERKSRCKGCEALTTQLDFERVEKQRLLEVILERLETNKEPNQTTPAIPQAFEPVNKIATWQQHRAILERNSRLELAKLNAAKERETDSQIKIQISQEIAELEKETGVADNA